MAVRSAHHNELVTPLETSYNDAEIIFSPISILSQEEMIVYEIVPGI